MTTRLQFDFHPAPAAPRQKRGPLRVLLLGDFSGRAAGERGPLATRPTPRLDLDGFDALMGRIAPRLAVAGADVGFTELDHFHPDALFARVPVFASLRQLRQRLLDPRQFAQAAAEMGATPATPAGDGGGDLLAGLLGGRPAAAAAPPGTPAALPGGIDALIRQAVAPHIVPDLRPQQAPLVAAVDAAIAAEMRGLLHQPALQALEAAWRGAWWLVSRLEDGDEPVHIHLLDASRDELLADLVAAGGRLADTGLHRQLCGQPAGEGWHLLAGLYRFGPGDVDMGLAAALGLLAAQAGSPLLAAADTALVTAEPAALAGWQALRQSQAGPWLGLVAPRLLMRLPYGAKSDPVSAFPFEEFPGGVPGHEQLLWAPGSLAAALLLLQAFTARGWDFEPGEVREIDDLPAYAFARDGERTLQPCAEVLLSETAGDALLSAGLMPLMSHKHRNAVTLLRFQSIAHPARPLNGLGR